MATIAKKDLMDQIAASTKTKLSTVKSVVQGFLNGITSELSKGNRLAFRDFGIFEVRAQAARAAHNPKTLELIDVPDLPPFYVPASMRGLNSLSLSWG